jgi:DNA-binding transcriptional regulator PaaX
MQTACQVECAQIIEWIAILGDFGVKQGTTKMAIRCVSKRGIYQRENAGKRGGA